VSASPTNGFAVPDGDPAQLDDAAGWHAAAAAEFDRHATLIDHTATSLHPVWRGEAASAYQTRSGTLAAHFRLVADSSRSASTILRRYARELEGYQQEGRRCLAEAGHWQRQVEADHVSLTRAEQELRAAQTAVEQLRHEMHAVAAAGGAGAIAHPPATANLAGAQAKLAEAQATVRDAQRALEHAEDELHHWQARGRQVWQEAHDAGRRASTALGNLAVPSPPSPGTPPRQGTPPSPGTPPAAADAVAIAAPAPIPAAAAVSFVTPASASGAGLPSGAGTTAAGPSLPAVAGGALQGAVTFGDLTEIGRRFGWSHAELQAWWQVIADESGGNPSAVNPSSGAFGIGQFLGATYKEYLPFGAGSPNPLDQLNAMAQYIHNRYGSPLAALAHECACHWY
jgi:hypothetical protein